MSRQNIIEEKADSLISLLTAQCADLEALLSLARQETAATVKNDFAEVMCLVEERAALGSRLEIYHRQIAEMRSHLGDDQSSSLAHGALINSTMRLAADIQAQDARTRPLLIAAQTDASQQLAHLSQTRRTVGAYLNDGRPMSIACDQLA